MKIRLLRYLVILSCLLLTSTVRAQESTETPVLPADQNVFGVIEAFWLPDDACALGVGWERIIFDWGQHQPDGPESWNTLNVDERWLAAAAACHREVIAVVKNTPAWATDGLPGVGVPRGLYLPIDDPDNLWANFMRRAAAFYASRGVSRFIIWNEPDIEPGTYGFEFGGTVEDYAQLLRVAYLAAREGNPNARINIAGTTYWHDINANRSLYVDRLLEILSQDPDAAANAYYFDAVNLHIYFRTDTITEIVSAFRSVLDRYGLSDKHIWIAETNASPNLDPQWPVTRPQWQITLDQQAAFVVQAAALGLAAGADHIGVYKFYDWSLPPGAESFGLIRADGSHRPAFEAWRTVIAQMNGVESAQLAQTDHTDVVRLIRSDGQTVIAVWARTAEPVLLNVSSTSEQAYMVDQLGDMITVRPTGDVYALMLSGAVCNEQDRCPQQIPVGGNVTLLLQPSGSSDITEISSAGETPLRFESN